MLTTWPTATEDRVRRRIGKRCATFEDLSSARSYFFASGYQFWTLPMGYSSLPSRTVPVAPGRRPRRCLQRLRPTEGLVARGDFSRSRHGVFLEAGALVERLSEDVEQTLERSEI